MQHHSVAALRSELDHSELVALHSGCDYALAAFKADLDSTKLILKRTKVDKEQLERGTDVFFTMYVAVTVCLSCCVSLLCVSMLLCLCC